MRRTGTSQQGMALVTALLVLIAVMLLAVTAIRGATVSLRLSQNEETRVNALETAQGVVDAIVADETNLPVAEGIGYRRCLAPAGTTPDFTCDASETAPSLPTLFSGGDYADYVYVEVYRAEPEFAPVVRNAGASEVGFDGALFVVTGGYDRAAEGFSAAEVSQGVLRLQARLPGLYEDGG